MKKFAWLLLMIGSLMGWVFTISGLLKPFQDERIKKVWNHISKTWIFGHPLELALALPIGLSKGLTIPRIILKTMLFGFTWWVPLLFGVVKK